MSDIRYNQWLHNSGTGGVSQDAGGNIGIGTTAPLIPVGAGNTTILNVGVVTANYIYGNGANLTALTAGQIPNLAASKITSGTVATARLGSGTANSGTFLRGDQSWQAVTSTTINSNTNNYLITGTGTADTLQGEANLTFDGAKLTVTSASKDLLYLNSTHSDGLQVPLQSNGTDFAYIGSAKTLFSGGSVTDLGFRVATNICFGIGASEKLRIDSSGRLRVGNTTANADTAFDNLIVGNYSGHTGISVLSGSSSQGAIGFAKSGAMSDGYVAYNHNSTATNSSMVIKSSGTIQFDTGGTSNRLRIKSDGDIVATGNIQSNNLPGNNILHNGEMAIWQRGTTSIYSSANKYLVDRWKILSVTDGNGAISQHTNVPTITQTGGSKFPCSLRFNCTTADTSLSSNHYINLSQRIEGRDIRHLGFGEAGTRYATLSFWQRSPSGTYHVSFRNANYNRYYIASYTAANNTWEKHELTIPIDTSGTWSTDHSTGLDITWSLGGGSGYTSGTVGSWSSGSRHAGSNQKNFFDSTSNDFYITGIQFEKGTIATPFEHKSYGEDLRICQRYFYSITAPPGFISSTEDLGMAFASSANEIQFPMNFPVQMRATPSVEQVTGTEYFLIGQGNLGGNKFISGNFIINNMAPHAGNLYADPDPNMSSYIGQAATIQSKNTAARLALRSEL